ncbi:MAG: glycosyltransferase [Bacteroidetes bacterium]|nr:glycosyltransferase [Bacteroidota bacterium]
MKVSIITVCYNAETTIESAIQSVLQQSYSDIEYIIVDGNSTDKTISIIEKYKNRISKLIVEKDSGMYFAINKGIKSASGDVVGILNADDFYVNEKIISLIVKEFQLKQTDCVYGDLQYVAKDNSQTIFRYWKSQPYNPKLFLKGWMPPHPTFFVRRNCYEKFGLFNTSFSIAADYELMLRFLYKNKISSSYIPEVLVKMRTGGKSNVTLISRIKANREDKAAWKINGLKPAPFTFIAKPLSKLRQFFPHP